MQKQNLFQAAAYGFARAGYPGPSNWELPSALPCTRGGTGEALSGQFWKKKKTEKRTTITHPTAAKEGSNAYQRREFMISDCVKMIKRDRLYS